MTWKINHRCRDRWGVYGHQWKVGGSQRSPDYWSHRKEEEEQESVLGRGLQS